MPLARASATPVWRRANIVAESEVVGPAMIEEDYATIFVASGWTCRLVEAGHLMAVRAAQ